MKIAVACVDLIPGNIRRQPWYYCNAIAEGLLALGHEVWILTDKEGDWPDGRPTLTIPGLRSFPRGINPTVGSRLAQAGFGLVFWSTGLTDFLFRKGLDTLEIPVIGVVTCPRYTGGELRALAPDLLANWRSLRQFCLSPLVTPAKVRRLLALPNVKGLLFQCQETLARYLTAQPNSGRTWVIPPPLPGDFLQSLQEVKRHQRGKGDGVCRVLYFGPPLSIRGIDTLIDAMAQVARREANVRLQILSRIEHRELIAHEERMRAWVRSQGLTSRTEIISGELALQELVQRLLAAQVVCLPFKGVVSDVPIAVLEAMATGIPLVTTEVAGVTEFARGGSCQVVPPADATALAQAILEGIHGRSTVRNEVAREEFLLRHNQAALVSSLERLMEGVA